MNTAVCLDVIAGIENYIAGSDGLKQDFDYFIKGFESGALEAWASYQAVPIAYLAAIAYKMKSLVKEQEQKTTKGKSFVQRSKYVSKLLAGNEKEIIQKGFYRNIKGENKQVICINGIYAIVFNQPLDIPVFEGNENEVKGLNVAPFFNDVNMNNFADLEFDIADIQSKIKIYNATHKTKKEREKLALYKNGKYFSACRLSEVFNCLGGNNIKWYFDHNVKSFDIFENENGIAVLLPLNPNNIEKRYNIIDI